MDDRHITGSKKTLDAACATAELLTRLRLDWALVGDLAFSAWTREPVIGGSVDVLSILSPDRMQQIPMMAANNGFDADPESVDQARELDLVPMAWPQGDGDAVRIHVLVASNALYAHMVRNSVDARIGQTAMRVIDRQDLALLLAVDGRAMATGRLERLTRTGEEFDFEAFNRRLETIGLGSKVVAR